ncbi:conserved hypothetical protein [Vibrio chagasii]|uniref:hypothetical protein n=1 Tax=Vibrio cyclitrophicus TaxID=47951 RepID=UPI000C82320D|nr:hypothetical protein [Vibrio cyclitrophicus]CAH6871797.1 conserved hypothetical protein [Vibrio chagasii]PMK99104.1 hypothetical protein BCT87_20845 [Vibrio cyclitrophicus]CAH7196062.1 conserved hypothetical protein [Vibrio chagasii]CAH7337131.1 conserved hypothetical protein [Vibrio chagasii]CAH7348674.1 conserved hypothetical protein [Vibrio chagasii]
MRIHKVESKLAWFNETSAGIGLVLGYVCYSLFWLLSPETKINIQVTEPIYEEVVLGYLPNAIKSKGILKPEVIEQKKLEVEKKEVVVRTPKFNDDGEPLFRKTTKTFKGMGTPSVVVQRIELLKPSFSSYSYNVKFTTYFSADISYVGTGFYYEQKTVEFSGGKNAELFALNVATTFAFISFALFLLKIRPNPRNCLKKFKKMRFDMGQDESSQ